jgi:hypothetical protein
MLTTNPTLTNHERADSKSHSRCSFALGIEWLKEIAWSCTDHSCQQHYTPAMMKGQRKFHEKIFIDGSNRVEQKPSRTNKPG